MPALRKITWALAGPIPNKYGSEYKIFLLSGIVIPEMRAILTLSLFMFRCRANAIQPTFALYDLAVIAHFLDR